MSEAEQLTNLLRYIDTSFIPSHEAVVRLVAHGFSNPGIAIELRITEKTVEKYIAIIYAELEIPTTREYGHRVLLALWWWRRNGHRGLHPES